MIGIDLALLWLAHKIWPDDKEYAVKLKQKGKRDRGDSYIILNELIEHDHEDGEKTNYDNDPFLQGDHEHGEHGEGDEGDGGPDW